MYPNNADPESAPRALPPQPHAARPVVQWSTGLCDCFDDPSNCCLTWCCPCITFGRIAEIVDRGHTTCTCAALICVALAYIGCACLYSCTYRTKLRAAYSLQEDPCADCCVHFWCTHCALCQEYRELKNRGFDPAIGWMANADRMSGATTMPPVVAPDPKSAPQALPPQPYAAQPHAVQWSTGLCDCFDDPSSCCVTCCCPCITFGRIAEIVDRGQTTCACAGLIYAALAYIGCACLYTCTYRTKLRAMYSLQEDPCADCCVHFWCTHCALCQEYRELKNRGFDPAMGWMANADRMNGATTTPPFVAPGMTR